MNNDIAISIKNLSKKYRLYDNPQHRMKEALNPFGKKYHRDFWALRDITFDVGRGETVGIIGKNGCGKSTLLQVVCGILQPTSGLVAISGRISALLELGSGFNKELTGRENIFIYGSIMGIDRKKMEKRFDQIAEFADIGDFIEQPVKTYSSGMYIRLAFAAAINVDPDILVVDEALAVGDIFFRQKCYNRIREIQANGATCLFVSHDTGAITNLCSRAILLEKGTIEFEGAPEEAVSRYYGKMGERLKSAKASSLSEETLGSKKEVLSASAILQNNIIHAGVKRHGAGGLIVAGARVVNNLGKDTLTVPQLESLNFYILLRASEQIYDPSTGIHLYDRLGNLVFAAGTRQLKQRLPDLKTGQELVVKMTLTFSVQPGEYTFSLGASEPSEEGPNIGYIQDRHEMLGPITVTAEKDQVSPFYGIAQLPMRIEYQQ